MSIKVSGGGGGGGASYPDVTGDGQTPGGLIVSGSVQAGDATAAATPSFHQLYGCLIVNAAPANGSDADPVAHFTQGYQLEANDFQSPLVLNRSGFLNGFKYLSGMLYGDDGSAQSDGILVQLASRVVPGHVSTAHDAFTVSAQGGVGLFGHAAPTAARTLAQATIDAITDANAKASIQACANALSDMGALTLT